MDLQSQARIKELAEQYGTDKLVVVLGPLDPGAVELWGETVTAGDPTYAGALAGVPLGLSVYHILEPEVKAELDPRVWDEQVSIVEMIADVEAISAAAQQVRAGFAS